MSGQPRTRSRRRQRTLVVAQLPPALREQLYGCARASQLPVSEVIRRGVVAALAVLDAQQAAR